MSYVIDLFILFPSGEGKIERTGQRKDGGIWAILMQNL